LVIHATAHMDAQDIREPNTLTYSDSGAERLRAESHPSNRPGGDATDAPISDAGGN
jgi:hypothetical protein